MTKKTTTPTKRKRLIPLPSRKQFMLAALVLGSALSSLSVYHYFFRPPRTPEHWMTVFVHGSFGTMLGLFSVFNVIKDKVDDTNYKRMTSHMRYDPFFHQLQPLQSPGLFPVTPTFTPQKSPVKSAIYPIAAAYEKLTQHVRPEKENQHFYTFGWSGLISQGRRRKEAIRFYNALQREYNALVAQGITPKIRLVVHSHGGNLILNMGGVHDLLTKGLEHTPKPATYPDTDQRASMKQIHRLLTQLGTQEEAAQKSYQKKLDYLPEPAPFKIDEVILLGTPVQPETAHFFLSSFFKKIYHIYSDNDVVQKADWVSTRRYYSEQRLPFSPQGKNIPDIKQIKLTLNIPTAPVREKTEGEEIEQHSQDFSWTDLTGKITALWSSVMGDPGQKQKHPDPSHKELWFMNWQNHDSSTCAQTHLQPYPFVILTPLIQNLIDQNPDMHDIDVRFKFKDKAVSLTSYPHEHQDKIQKVYVPRALLQELQEKAQLWLPNDVDADNQMNILHKYSKMLAL